LKTVTIIENLTVNSDILIIDGIHVTSDGASNDVNEVVEPNKLTVPSKPLESPYAEYSFMVVPIDSSFSESTEFLIKIQQIISSASSFSNYLEFVSKANVPLSLDVCPPRHLIYLILRSLGVMSKMSTTLYSHVSYIDNHTNPIRICNDTYKFAAYP